MVCLGNSSKAGCATQNLGSTAIVTTLSRRHVLLLALDGAAIASLTPPLLTNNARLGCDHAASSASFRERDNHIRYSFSSVFFGCL